jgi:voltage-gated potassium channel Kch
VLFASVTLVEIDPAFTNIFEAFWFNVVTITSVGYGDISPLTEPGKIIAMLSIIIGLTFVSIFTAAMSAYYMEKPETETRNKVKNELKKHAEVLKEENERLNERISFLEENNKLLNEKLDLVLDLLEKEK